MTFDRLLFTRFQVSNEALTTVAFICGFSSD